MRVVMFYHSVRSDWNHGNAHFLRGVATELIARGHDVRIGEPANAWSATNLATEHGGAALEAYRRVYPLLSADVYDPDDVDLESLLEGADLVLVHEWNAHELVARLGELRAQRGDFVLLFHDTHHRAVTDPASMSAYDLRHYDGVLAYGEAVRDIYLANGWTQRAYVWHEAADVRVFHPTPQEPREGDVVWIGNWGDEERSVELQEFLLGPIAALRLRASVYGVRYPEHARKALRDAGVKYRGWLPNYEAPAVFARYRATVHVPRRPYARALRGIPTIRVFEALACGVPLISAPWDDVEHLFTPGRDYLVARDGTEMREHLRRVVKDAAFARQLAEHGRQTILTRHTCAHRVDELLAIVRQLAPTPLEDVSIT
jgi:spore maturation protein CgeB